MQMTKPIWLALMAIGFVWFWPVGLAVLAYLVWNGELGWKGATAGFPWNKSFWSSGNKAYDTYYQEALSNLEKEKEAFAEFIQEKLNEKDQAEFAEFRAKHKV